ncbi:putative toxin-antitoxin system toxin component, PIN family [Comamonadaceae bacterium G21597-S1]|nr:putative toxin-antitoxin system toxin component, PIN family [Comamonadaceae bacterium G21597-S1]
MTAGAPPAPVVVIDTNIVLDLLLFADASTAELQAALRSSRCTWLATAAMREELRRVLAYPALVTPMAARGCNPDVVLAGFDKATMVCPVPPTCPIRCSDPDDQGFIDLAVAHRAMLLSKDKAVLRLRRRLAPLAVPVQARFSPSRPA